MSYNEERQKRINQIEKENELLKKLNDLSSIRKRVESEPSLSQQVGLDDNHQESDNLDKIAISNKDAQL